LVKLDFKEEDRSSMPKSSFGAGTNLRNVRVAICALVLLIILSATALARGKQPASSLAAPLMASTIQPTKSPTTAPKTRIFSTPTQTTSYLSRAPRKLSPDPDTVALYHFDNQIGQLVPDETGHYTGTLYGTAFITPTGLFGGALQTDGNGSYVRVGSLGDMPQGTFEAFVDFRNACYGTVGGDFGIFAAGGEYGTNHTILRLGITRNQNSYPQASAEAFLHFKIITADGRTARAVSGINPCRYLDGSPQNFGFWNLPTVWPYETWRFHHVAATWGPRGLEIWVDGVLHGVGLYDNYQDLEYIWPYQCSPQEQVQFYPNTPYPACGEPQMGLVQGAYSGGVPSSAYTTFLIGCDAGGACFNGRIDEARISNVQRTFRCAGPVGPLGPPDCVDPTVTPTPTQTPDNISSEYSVDGYTLALYHLNFQSSPWPGVLDQVSGNYSGLNANAVVVPGGRYNGSLSVDGNGSYFATYNVGNPWRGAVEAWVNLTNPNGSFHFISAGDGFASKMSLGVISYWSPNIRFGIQGNWADSRILPTALVGGWHHVAGTWGPRGMEIWIDGSLCGTNSFTGKMGDSVDNFRAACKIDNNGVSECMQGGIDELRVSNIQRSYSPIGLGLSPLRLRPVPNITPARTPVSSAQPPASIFFYYFPFLSFVPPPLGTSLIQCPVQ
jgi:concanavalin A-like lectin/glucanase superfamily protein